MKPRLSLFNAFLALFAGAFLTGCGDDDGKKAFNPVDMPYSVHIDPADFEGENITGNEYFPMIAGTSYVYEGEDEDGVPIRVEIKVSDQGKEIAGVRCITFEFREFERGELVEETSDWYAQDKKGNVWYFGEDSKEIENGQVVSREGSWEAGVDGALPGIIMLAHPIEGLWYRQEYRVGEAEDVAQVLSLNETVTVPAGTFANCVKIAEWNPLEPGILEHDYYAPGVGSIREIAVQGESGFEELVEIAVP